MDDARKIIREEAINILHGIQADNLNLDNAYTKDKYEALDMAIKALEQESETGHWIEEWLNEYKSCPIVICSNCGKGGFTVYKEFNYCPNCGAKMESEE